MRETLGTGLIAIVSLAAILLFLVIEPIPQDIAYHLFADDRTWLGIANILNVASNLFFLFAGLSGIYHVLIVKDVHLIHEIKYIYVLFFIGVVLVAFGSAYYHLAPTNASLVWDRLPMSIAFMSLFSFMLAEYISVRLARVFFPVLLICGAASVIYWGISEARGEGDLRLYLLVQFLPMVFFPVLLIFFTARYSHSYGYWGLFVAYSLAKLLELFDREVYDFLAVISGHSLKHIVSALGIYILLRACCRRRPLVANNTELPG